MSADGQSKRQLTDSPGSDDGGDLYLMNADGGSQRALVTLPGSQRPNTWLPDGRILFASNETEEQPLPHWYVVRADGSGLASVPALDTVQANAQIDWIP